jgi:sigma-B regulation protein RsbU (phosphoserine phosphatase)
MAPAPDEPTHAEHQEGARALVGLDALAEIVDSFVALEEFRVDSREFLHQVMGTMLSAKGAVYLWNDAEGKLEMQASRGLPQAPICLAVPDAAALAARRAPFFGREMPLPGVAPDDLLAPLSLRGRLLGLLRLGPKFMGQRYGEGDLDMLKVLSLQTSVALSAQTFLQASRDTSLRLRRKVLEMETLRDMGMQISGLRDLSTLCDEILERAMALIAPRAGLLVLKDANGTFVPRAWLGLRTAPEPLPADTSILVRALQSPEPVVLPAEGDARALGATHAVLATPIRTQERLLGALLLLDKEGRSGLEDFHPDDASLLAGFASQAAIAIENAHLHETALEQERTRKELQLAAAIQQNLLPQQMPAIPGFDVAALTRPCRTVGGDYYDFLPLPDGRWLVVVADVAGKSIPAALLVFTLNATLHALQRELVEGKSLPDFVAGVNGAVYRSSTSSRYITCFLGILDPARRTLLSVNAGHNAPLLHRSRRDGGPILELKRGGLCLGMFDHARYEEELTELHEGDRLALYSDGISEARNLAEDEYGADRLAAALRAAPSGDAEVVAATLVGELDAFVGEAPPHDDVTLVVLRCTGAP